MKQQATPAPSTGRPEGSTDAQLELRVSGLEKRYGQTRALDGLDLVAHAGEVLGVAGPNGAGKSTLVTILAGESVQDAGDISLSGRRWALSERQRSVAVVHQEAQLFPTLTVAENLMVGVERTRLARPGSTEAERTMLQGLGIAHLVDTPVEECSLVARQLVEIARAGLRDASMFLFDEPNSALTVEESSRVFDHIRDLRAQARCVVLLVTHRLTDLVELCDRVAVIRDGRVARVLAGSELTTGNLGQGIAGTWGPGGSPGIGRPDDGPQATVSTSAPADVRAPAGTRELGTQALLRTRGWTDAKGSTFSDIDVEVHAGEALVLTGQEGSGGRELIRALAGLRRARGTLEVDGASSGARRTALCYVPADRAIALFQNFSVAANLAARLGRGEIASQGGFLQVGRILTRGESLVEQLLIRTESARHSITSLSGGNQQKVSVGSALAVGPRVLLIEEPTRGVDVTTKQEIYSSLHAYLSEGNAVIAFSPELGDLFHLGDTARVMINGRLSESIRVAEVERLEDLATWVDRVASGELAAGTPQ